jgi:hypothetical protein
LARAAETWNVNVHIEVVNGAQGRDPRSKDARSCRGQRVDSWVWSVGPGGTYSGRSTATRVWNHDADPPQPTRSAITDAGIEGNSDNRTRTGSSNPSNTDAAGGLEYDGGPCERTPSRPSSARRPSGQRSLAATTLRHMKATDLRPLLRRDHPPNLGSGGSLLAERHWLPLQRASTAGDRVRRAAHTGTGPVACGAASLFRQCAGRCSLLDRTVGRSCHACSSR